MDRIIRRLIPKRIKQEFIQQGRRNAFKGNNVTCPCCENTYVTFLPFGVKKRANAQCPGCYSLERHRLIWLYLKNKTGFFQKPLRVLHIAPEQLFFQKFRQMKNLTYVPGAKFGEGYEDEYPAGTKNIDITAIDESDNSFDVVLCNHVLEHIPDDGLAMRELYRVLKPGGWAILQVPIDLSREVTYEDFSIVDPVERQKAFGQQDHVRWYGQDYSIRLRSAGFTVQCDAYARQFSPDELFRYGLSPNEDIYLCSK